MGPLFVYLSKQGGQEKKAGFIDDKLVVNWQFVSAILLT
jgi:predicted 3-demethylubiquinone-9 3-methyltransferase (glyoxalase superfamily)